jgi:hypothetical protein
MARRWQPYRHVLRVAALFLFGFVTFLVVRSLLVPADFGRYGFYRAGALDAARAYGTRYAGEASCKDCHEEPFEVRKGQGHQLVKCEACHGPLARHSENNFDVDKAEVLNSRLSCFPCHVQLKGRPASLPQFDPNDHASAVEDKCIECHLPHRPKAKVE